MKVLIVAAVVAFAGYQASAAVHLGGVAKTLADNRTAQIEAAIN